MAALEEGCQYGLSSSISSSSNRSVVHVKLTDTSLKTIEDYLKNKHPYSSNRPSIQFQGSNGTIEIPQLGSGDSDVRTFHFSLSSIQGDANGSIDCVQHSISKHGTQLCLEGSMSHKLSIQATDEVFKATKERVTQAELDNKKVSTKVIKQSGPNISRRKTVVLKKNRHPLPIKTHTPTPAIKPKPSSTPVTFSQRPSPSPSSHGNSHGNSHGSATAVSPHSVVRETSAVVVSSNASKPSSPNLTPSSSASSNIKQSTNSAIMNMPYRDRIIHLLAVRPFKKPELILKLRKDGILQKDRDSLGTILNQVAVTKDNKFSLAKFAYADVRPDWPFYTDEDRKILKKKLESLSSPASSPAAISHTDSQKVSQTTPVVVPTPQPTVASRSPDSASSVTQQPQKRPIEEPQQPQTAKKQRISHFRKENKPVHHTPESDKLDVSSSTPSSDKSHRKENISETSVNVASSTVDTPDYVGKYRFIQSNDQRQLYKNKFNQEYEEYRELHSNVEKVSKKFAELEVLMKQTPEGTDEYENLKNRIRREYRLQKSDPKYIEQKHRFEYLHGKLAHIKKLILDFDQMQTTVCS